MLLDNAARFTSFICFCKVGSEFVEEALTYTPPPGLGYVLAQVFIKLGVDHVALVVGEHAFGRVYDGGLRRAHSHHVYLYIPLPGLLDGGHDGLLILQLFRVREYDYSFADIVILGKRPHGGVNGVGYVRALGRDWAGSIIPRNDFTEA